jgi:potassium inwardly-rectifying channel subfamily J
MLKYDDENDQYIEVSSNESVDLPHVYRKRCSISATSYRSSRCSIRSNRNEVHHTRIINKIGRLNTHHVKIPKKRLFYFRDLGNTLLNIRWRWITITLFVVNFISFFVFGLLWMWIAYISGDFEENTTDLCIINTKNLTGYVLLSIETMLTIGYGYRYPTEQCIQGWIVPFLQALVSVGIQGVLITAVYVKISKPFTKNTLGFFSTKAVICLRDGELCFVFRITDLTGKISIGTKITMYFVDKQVKSITNSFDMKQMNVQPHGFLIFPIEIIHVIDSQSPLWKIPPHELLLKPIEIIVVAEGLSVVTGQPSQNRTSYINTDILWGHRFTPCVNFDGKKEKYIINYKDINNIYPFDTPLCSAQILDGIKHSSLGV